MKKIIIAAVSENFVIGKNGNIPWYNKEELAHFRKTTSGYPVIMGRKTWQSIGKPLEDRINIVITHNVQEYPHILAFDSLSKAFNYCDGKYDIVFIIGGESIFKQSISFADEIILSKMKFIVDGDVFFPEIELNMWELNSVEEFTDFTIHHYIRIIN
ncbi:MAG: dihydrofolate reductase [Melioribacter sp.]|uniref:dihydrofolate reductase n=1 Tax=Rosettibacter primus TaxID=3111523 RepID=UPI00247DCCCD|nr:dihydrofolate reductase [Melioribacter sp.]